MKPNDEIFLPLKKGELVFITYEHRTVAGVVEMASSNGVSLMLAFDAMLGGFVGMLPCLWDGKEFRDLVQHKIVTVTRQREHYSEK
jgi:hypothetical protein